MTAEDSTYFTIIFPDFVIKTTRKITSPIRQTYSWTEDRLNLVRFREHGPLRQDVIIVDHHEKTTTDFLSHLSYIGCTTIDVLIKPVLRRKNVW